MMVAVLVYLALGLDLTISSIIQVVARPAYWEPVTSVDYVAVWTWSLAFLLLAVAAPLLVRDAFAGREALVAAGVVSVATIVTAIANAIEDGIGIESWGSVYVVGSLTTLGGMLVVAARLSRAGRPRHTAVILLWLAGMAMNTWGLGILALAGSLVAIDARRRATAVA
jgi:hypothetical protein